MILPSHSLNPGSPQVPRLVFGGGGKGGCSAGGGGRLFVKNYFNFLSRRMSGGEGLIM